MYLVKKYQGGRILYKAEEGSASGYWTPYLKEAMLFSNEEAHRFADAHRYCDARVISVDAWLIKGGLFETIDYARRKSISSKGK